VAGAAGDETIAGLRFPDSAHVLDPRAVCEVLARAAVERGTTLQRARVRSLAPRGDQIEVLSDAGALTAATVIVCAGAWSAPLLAPFGLRAPLEAVRGYHVELPGHAALVDAPLVYMDRSIVVTPMTARLRASSYMEFSRLEAAPDPRKPARLRANLRRLGYRCEAGLRAGSARVRFFRTTCRGSAGRPVREALLRHRPPAPGADPRTGDGRSDGRAGLGARARPRRDTI